MGKAVDKKQRRQPHQVLVAGPHQEVGARWDIPPHVEFSHNLEQDILTSDGVCEKLETCPLFLGEGRLLSTGYVLKGQ